jgi:Flp pilus assembly protein TadG
LFARQGYRLGTLIGASWSPSVMIAILLSKLAARRKRRSSPADFARNQNGAAALEFAIVAAPTIALTLAILQTALAFFAGQVLETAVAESSRLILTGQAASMTQGQFATAVCGSPGYPTATWSLSFLFNCANLMIDVNTANSFTASNTSMPTLTFNGSNQVTNTWSYNIGGPGDIVVVRVMYQWPVFLGPLGLSLSNEANGNLELMATAAFKNEPY